jgi:hypothetical protein
MGGTKGNKESSGTFSVALELTLSEHCVRGETLVLLLRRVRGQTCLRSGRRGPQNG